MKAAVGPASEASEVGNGHEGCGVGALEVPALEGFPSRHGVLLQASTLEDQTNIIYRLESTNKQKDFHLVKSMFPRKLDPPLVTAPAGTWMVVRYVTD